MARQGEQLRKSQRGLCEMILVHEGSMASRISDPGQEQVGVHETRLPEGVGLGMQLATRMTPDSMAWPCISKITRPMGSPNRAQGILTGQVSAF